MKEIEACRECKILVVENGASGHISLLSKAARNELRIK